MRTVNFSSCILLVLVAVGCDSNASSSSEANGTAFTQGGGQQSSANSQSSGGAKSAGGSQSAGGSEDTEATQSRGGSSNAGGSTSTQKSGGSSNAGGSTSTQKSGGSSNAGGSTSTQKSGGSSNAGGSGGTQTSGGSQSTGGSGGTQTTGGSSNAGGSSGMQTSGGSQSTGGSTPSTDSCSDTATESGKLDTADGSAEIPVTDKEKSYTAAPNWWSKFDGQSVDYQGLSFTVNDPKNVASGTSNNPTGYPTLFIGTYAGHVGKGSNLPKQVSALSSVPTIFSTNSLDRDTSQFNAAYDVWFTAGSSTLPPNQYNPGKGGAYLMVWLYKPAQRQPRGGVCSMSGCTPNYTGHTVAGVSPSTWDVWVDNTDPLCISYVSTTPLDSLTFDLNKFIRDAVSSGYGIKDSMYLSVVFAGFEIWGNGNGLQLKQYCAQVN